MEATAAFDRPALAASTSGPVPPPLRLQTPGSLTAWILFCAFCNVTGWLLSALHQLNAAFYALALAIAFASAWVLRNKLFPRAISRSNLRRIKPRFRRGLPLAFLILGFLAILGGLIHPPNNYDALAYRTPRVLHWLAEGRWHWIHTDFPRLNVRSCGMEWVTAPLIALMRTDRWFFLINAICFLLLPGRVFAILTRLGVRPRVAWHWMWLFPTGYCFLLQAGSIGNDLFGAFFAMAAIELGLRARESRSVNLLWLSMLAAGLMTASKTFNLLLLPAWLVAAFPSLRLLWNRPLVSGLVSLISLCSSFLPTALLNFHFCGDWTGQASENMAAMRTGAPLLHVIVNSLLLILHNFAPTIFPWADSWNHVMERLLSLSPSLAASLAHHFEPAAAKFLLGEMQIEEMAGLGLGVSLLLLGTFIHRFAGQHRISFSNLLRWGVRYESLVCLAAWAGVLILLVTSGLNCPGRYLAPFYVVLLAPLLAGTSVAQVFARTWWRCGVIVAFVLAGLLIVLTQARPLWPAVTILRALDAEHSAIPVLRRGYKVYSVYAGRADAFQPARAILPPDANPLGLVTSDDPETSLWRPFGSRRVVHICNGDTAEQIRAQGIKYALVSSNVLRAPFDEWLSRTRAQPLLSLNLELRAGKGLTPWYLVQMK